MKKNIAVLGAGPMGLAIAYQLVKDGYAPVVFEADDRVGGMAAMFDFGGLEIERYYHFHCTSDNDLFNILEELNLKDKMKWKNTKMGYWYNNALQSWGDPISLLKFKGLGIIPKLRYGLHAFMSTKKSNWDHLDKLSAISWIKSWVGDKAYNVLWSKLFEYKFYDLSNDISAAWIWSRIKRVGTSRYNIFKEKLGYLEGGSATLLNEMKSFIEQNGGVFKLQSPVSKVVIEGNKITGLIANDIEYKFDKVFSTIPMPYIPKIIPDLPKELLDKYKALKNVAVVCVIAKLKKQVTENFWLNINDKEMDIPGLVEYSNLKPSKDHIVYVPFYMPGEHEKYQDSNDIFIAKVKQYLKKINLSLTDDDFIDIYVNRYRFAQPVCSTNFLEKLPPFELPINGLWVADTSFYYPEDRGISESIKFGRMMAQKVDSRSGYNEKYSEVIITKKDKEKIKIDAKKVG